MFLLSLVQRKKTKSFVWFFGLFLFSSLCVCVCVCVFCACCGFFIQLSKKKRAGEKKHFLCFFSFWNIFPSRLQKKKTLLLSLSLSREEKQTQQILFDFFAEFVFFFALVRWGVKKFQRRSFCFYFFCVGCICFLDFFPGNGVVAL